MKDRILIFREKLNVLSSIQNSFRKITFTIIAIFEFVCNVLKGFSLCENVWYIS